MSVKNIVISLLVIAGFILFYTWQRMEVLRISYEIDKLRNEKNELANKNKFLLVEVANLKSLDRVEKASRDELGLITPDRFEVLTLEAENEQDEGIKNNRYGLAGIKTENKEHKGVNTRE